MEVAACTLRKYWYEPRVSSLRILCRLSSGFFISCSISCTINIHQGEMDHKPHRIIPVARSHRERFTKRERQNLVGSVEDLESGVDQVSRREVTIAEVLGRRKVDFPSHLCANDSRNGSPTRRLKKDQWGALTLESQRANQKANLGHQQRSLDATAFLHLTAQDLLHFSFLALHHQARHAKRNQQWRSHSRTISSI